MGGNRKRAQKSPKKLTIRAAAKHHNRPAVIPCRLALEDHQEGSATNQNIKTDHSYASHEPSESLKFNFLKKKVLGDITVAHLNVEKILGS